MDPAFLHRNGIGLGSSKQFSMAQLSLLGWDQLGASVLPHAETTQLVTTLEIPSLALLKPVYLTRILSEKEDFYE
jgi:hypothetical protein